jgi:hypothetical protein
MYPKILFFLLPLALLFASIVVIFLWDRKSRDNLSLEPGNGKPEGAFRAFYHVLWMLLLWSGLAYSLPFWFSYKEKIEALPLPERWFFAGKILVFPLIMLALLGYGARRGYLKWIDGLDWPDKENQ